ncbi:MAG: threonine aldolase, partial [candidate division Zixibacteria bacterium]|nr:threonine aldolase [candidate division Zixibacteria bacterium]
ILGEGLNALDTFEVDMEKVQTNIVAIYLKSESKAAEVIEKMASIGIRAVAYSETKIRFVTHLDVSEDDCKEAVQRISKAFS